MLIQETQLRFTRLDTGTLSGTRSCFLPVNSFTETDAKPFYQGGNSANRYLMIDSLLEELSQQGAIGDGQTTSAPQASSARSSERSFLGAIPIVQRVVGRRRFPVNSANASDLVQEIALRLWRWATNHREKSESMSDGEWKAFAARTAYNELSRSSSRESASFGNVDPYEVSAIGATSVEGQSEIEVFSLIRLVWQGICELSVRQRRALLLHSQELIIYFLQTGITERQLAETLDFSEKYWSDIRDRLPMTDAEIAKRTEGTPGSIKKARFEARAKLEGSIRR